MVSHFPKEKAKYLEVIFESVWRKTKKVQEKTERNIKKVQS